jgi:hypothetical protein
MAATETDVMKLVAELEDRYSIPMKAMRKAVLEMGKATQQANEHGSKAAREHAKHIRELQERFEKVKGFVAGAVTPALATMGIAALGTSEAIGALAESLRKAGEQYNMFNATAQRGGVSVQRVGEMQKTFELLGSSADKANDAVAAIGETKAKLDRHQAAEMIRLQSLFGNGLPWVEKALHDAKTLEDAVPNIVKLLTDKSIPVDMREKMATGLGIDPALVFKTRKEVDDALAQAHKSFTDFPLPIAQMKALDEAFGHLKLSQDEFWREMNTIFGSPAAKLIDGTAEKIHQLAEAIKELMPLLPDFLKKADAGASAILKNPDKDFLLGGRLPNGKTPWGDLADQSGLTKLKDAVSEGVVKGLQAYGSALSGPGGIGYAPMAYHPSQRGGGYFGSRQYPALSDDQARTLEGGSPRSMGNDAGKGSGDGLFDIGGGKIGSTFDRSRFAAELKANPALKEKIFQLAAGEDRPSKGQSLLANQAVMETMMNRAIVRGTTLAAQAKWYGRERGGYYAGKPSVLTQHEREMSERNLAAVLAGSNITDYATDNSSGALAARERMSGKFRFHTAFNRESFFSPGWAEPKFRDRYDALRQRLAQEHGAHLADHIRHHNLLKMGRQSGLYGGSAGGHLGHLTASVDFTGMPRGVRAKATASGLFKEVQLNRGRAMPLASQDA